MIVRNGEVVLGTNPQTIFDLIHPIGEVYVQYPSQTAPQTLYNATGIKSTWTDISSQYSGAFFRANGGNSASFGSKQSEGIPNIKAEVSCESEGLFNGRGTMTVTGGFSLSNNTSWAGGDNNVGGRPRTLTFDASLGTYNTSGTLMTQANSPIGKSDHITPVNYSIKIWKRTA